MNNGLVKHKLGTNHSFNFKDSKILVCMHKKQQKIPKSNISLNYNYIKQKPFFQCFLFDPICAEKLQNPLFRIIWIYRLYIV